MRIRHSWLALGLALLVFSALLSCQKAEAPASSPVAAAPATPAAPPTPPPPPQTSVGKLVSVETAQKVKVRVQYLTLNGLKSGTDDKKAGKGKTFVVLHFEGKPPAPKKKESGLVTLSSGGSDGRLQAKDNSAAGEPNLWLTDATGAKYSDWSSFWEKDTGTIAFEVPEGVEGLVLHDGNDHAYPIKPVAATAPAPAVAGGAK